ncbi:MAG TPA: sigma-70 family RNA polymerase sigma factor [Thermoanaerobaculia bacterium]|nr:sigma-70 family RNA polymerase sigma factor [Thermoanaerobaculia bacterium]
MSTEESKEALLARLGRTGDWSVAGRDFRQIFSEFYPQVLRYFAQHGLGEEDSRDLAQETMLRIYRNLPSFTGEAVLGTWIFEITANVYKNAVRTRSTRKRESPEVSLEEGIEGESHPVDEGEDPMRDLLTGERAQILAEALRDLPPQMRRCVELRVHRDLKYREIAELLRISIDTVKAHLFQARQILRSKLAVYFDSSGADDR